MACAREQLLMASRIVVLVQCKHDACTTNTSKKTLQVIDRELVGVAHDPAVDAMCEGNTLEDAGMSVVGSYSSIFSY